MLLMPINPIREQDHAIQDSAKSDNRSGATSNRPGRTFAADALRIASMPCFGRVVAALSSKQLTETMFDGWPVHVEGFATHALTVP